MNSGVYRMNPGVYRMNPGVYYMNSGVRMNGVYRINAGNTRKLCFFLCEWPFLFFEWFEDQISNYAEHTQTLRETL